MARITPSVSVRRAGAVVEVEPSGGVEVGLPLSSASLGSAVPQAVTMKITPVTKSRTASAPTRYGRGIALIVHPHSLGRQVIAGRTAMAHREFP